MGNIGSSEAEAPPLPAADSNSSRRARFSKDALLSLDERLAIATERESFCSEEGESSSAPASNGGAHEQQRIFMALHQHRQQLKESSSPSAAEVSRLESNRDSSLDSSRVEVKFKESLQLREQQQREQREQQQ